MLVFHSTRVFSFLMFREETENRVKTSFCSEGKKKSFRITRNSYAECTATDCDLKSFWETWTPFAFSLDGHSPAVINARVLLRCTIYHELSTCSRNVIGLTVVIRDSQHFAFSSLSFDFEFVKYAADILVPLVACDIKCQ